MDRFKAVCCGFWLLAASVCALAEDIPRGRLPGKVVPTAYRLDLEVIPDKPRFRGQVEIDVEVRDIVEQIWLHGKDLDVSAASISTEDGRRIPGDYTQVSEDGIALLSFDERLPRGSAKLALNWSATFGQGLAGLYHVRAADADYAFTQFESIYARRAFPSFDEPAYKTPFDIRVTTRQAYRAFSNTQVTDVELLDDDLQRLRFRTTEKLPTYLIAFAVGPLDLVEWEAIPASAQRPRPLQLRGIATKGQGKRLDYALRNTAPILLALEEYFDSPYPYDKLDIVAVPDFAAGAMENAGLITYREPLILMSEDPPVSQRRYYAAVHAHELAHQWFGNLVTMPWWDDIWLNEAFASWMQAKGAQAWDSSYHFERDVQVRAIDAMAADVLANARQIREPVSDAGGIVNAFDSITYRKGAGVLQMLERYLGGEVFRDGIRLHMRRFPHASATVYDLLDSLTEVAGEEHKLKELVESFLFQSGVPYLMVTPQCLDGKFSVTLAQERYLPLGSTADPQRSWLVPVCLAMGTASTRREECVVLEKPNQSFALPGACPNWVMPNAGGSGYFRWRQRSADLDNLQAVFLSQLDAGERLSYVDSLVASVQSGTVALPEFLAQLPMIASAPERSVVRAPVDFLKRLVDEVTPVEQREPIRAAIAQAYLPRLALLESDKGGESPAERTSLRRSLTQFLALDIAVPAVREKLWPQAVAYLDSKQADETVGALSGDLLQAGLSLAILQGGKEQAERLIRRFRGSDDARFRQAAVRALAVAADEPTFERVREFMSSGQVRANEYQTWLAELLNPWARPMSWPWIQASLDQILDGGSERLRRDSPLWFGQWLCTRDDRQRLAELYAPRVNQTVGAPRKLDQALETVDLCIAQRDHLAGTKL